MNKKKFIIAAIKAATTINEIEYVFNVFNIKNAQEKCTILKHTMNDVYLNLPNDWNDRLSVLMLMFLDGEWRYADTLQTIKNNMVGNPNG